MDYFARVTSTRVFNYETGKSDFVFRGCIFLKSGGGYPSRVPDLLIWDTGVKKTHNEALQPLYRELERLDYNINGHKINCSMV